jgi:hypothetical protein
MPRGGTRVSTKSLIDKEAAARLFQPSGAHVMALGATDWIRFGLHLAGIVWEVIRRVRAGRDHGKYVTFVEEVLRALYIGNVGRGVWWDPMKADTADAFKAGDEHGGTVFLNALHDQLGTQTPPRITLVAHSAGAIYVGNFLRTAAQRVPDLKFDLVFEAPAATHDFVAKVLEEHASRIAHFRMFGMNDDREHQDHLVPVLYPASLLYFVSGLLEDEADQPILGMQRFDDERHFPAHDFPNVGACRRFVAAITNGEVWAPKEGTPGSESNGQHHGDFDDKDDETKASVAYIVANGFGTAPSALAAAALRKKSPAAGPRRRSTQPRPRRRAGKRSAKASRRHPSRRRP